METTVAPVQTPTTPKPISTPTLASRGTRLAAALVDNAIFMVIYLVALLALNEPAIFILGLGILAAYQIYLLTTQGQTIGKMLMKIRIIKCDTHTNGGFVPNVLLRGIVNGIISFIPFYALVDILFIFREDRRCIHDMIANTQVVEE